MSLHNPSEDELKKWASECREWEEIGKELVSERPGEIVSAYQVSLEQRKRMLARGDRPVFERHMP